MTGSNTFTYTMASVPTSNAGLASGTTMTATYADTWIGNQNRMFDTYFPVRTANVIAEFQAAGVYPSSVAAPEFSGLPTGGDLTGPLTVTNPSGAGTIYYTTDGSDPRVANLPSPILAAGTPSSVTEISLNGTTATVRVPDNGYANGQTVAISGAVPSNYDGNFVISNVTQDTFQITISGSPAAATGTIVCQPYGISPSGNSVIVWLPNNGLAVGNNVLMSGAVQETALNGVFAVTAATANTFSFTLAGASLDAADTAITAQRIDVAISSITYSGNTATVTTATANSYGNGALVRIVGANVATFNGDFLITVLNSTQFQYTMSTTPGGGAHQRRFYRGGRGPLAHGQGLYRSHYPDSDDADPRPRAQRHDLVGLERRLVHHCARDPEYRVPRRCGQPGDHPSQLQPRGPHRGRIGRQPRFQRQRLPVHGAGEHRQPDD